ncbi:MAG TPA: gluconokinase [Stellaceae bacterium]|nr:gluconokinase [Stellaceae bacterium]
MQLKAPVGRIAIVMGVAGAGKTTVGQRLARRLGWRFLEGDALHTPENVAKMRSGQPLDDNDRAPWLRALTGQIDAWRRAGVSGVVSCSALKRAYRDMILGHRTDMRLIYLHGPRQLLAARLAARTGHFMPAGLLDSQLSTLEPPGPDEQPIAVSIEASVDAIVEQIVAALLAAGTIAAPGR